MRVDGEIALLEYRMMRITGDETHRSPWPSARAPVEGHFAGYVANAMQALVRSSALRAGIDPALLAAVAQTESGFDPAATSRSGAAGLMQLMPRTARELGVDDRYDPAQSLRGGATYLRTLLDRFDGDVRSAIAAYNAGPSAVERYGGVPPYEETRAYVRRVLAAYRG